MLKKGFTLIELLIVMAILGVLAIVVLIAINPVQQLARTRDAGRKSGVTQLGHALEAYAVTHAGEYPVSGTPADWVTQLVDAGELSTVPAEIDYSVGTQPTCAADEANWCYNYNATTGLAIAYAGMESDSEQSKCTSATTPVAYFVFSTADGRGGTVCMATGSAPTAQAQTFID